VNRLSDTLRAAADEPVDLDLGALHARVDHRRRRRARARAAAGIIGVVAVLGGAGVAAGVGSSADGRAEDVGVDPSVTPESTSTVAEETTTSTTLTDPSSTSTEAPTTTTSPPTTAPPATTAPPPSTTAPAPTVLELHGTWAGTGRTGFGDKGCDDLSGTTRSDVAMDDGTVWRSGADVCASIIDEMWVADGSFFLTDPAGDTLTGPYVISTPMGTTGVPYTITFTEGTGVYAGATGQCHVTIGITPPGGLLQEQAGEITCTITLAGAGAAGAQVGTTEPVPEVV
jgi:hypothetical protein